MLKRIRIQNFRSHGDYILDIGEKSTLIYGKNGSGKTSLLEAIYFTLRGTSFRSSDKEILKKDSLEKWFRIDLEMDDNRVVKFDSSKKNSQKTFEIGGYKKHRLSNEMKRPIVLFEPDDLQLLSGSPQRRRDFIDRMISQIDPHFNLSLNRYNKALKQRNKLLKQENISIDELFPWNIMLAEYGAEIIKTRIEIINKINERITKVYKHISGVDDDIEMIYSDKLNSKDYILRIMAENIDRDKILGYTSFGPHKHDFSFKFNNGNASEIASRGEVRSLILALKFIETDIITNHSKYRPIILLDDVFSELDSNRQRLLTSYFSQYQTIITSTNKVNVEDCQLVKIIDR